MESGEQNKYTLYTMYCQSQYNNNHNIFNFYILQNSILMRMHQKQVEFVQAAIVLILHSYKS